MVTRQALVQRGSGILTGAGKQIHMKNTSVGNLNRVARQRLNNQRIDNPVSGTVREVVSWMGAMQAQDYAMVKWAIGLRLSGATLQTVNEAIDEGEIIRSHLLRPTWHIVSRDDYRWMLSLSAPSVRSSLRSRHRTLKLTDRTIARSHKLIEKALTDHDCMTREELTDEFKQAGIPSGDNRYSHLLLCAELDGVICSGKDRNGKYTYSLLDRRVPENKPVDREEALFRLARTYFRSHGPATLGDFTWWSGLPAGDARKALESCRSELDSEAIGQDDFRYSVTTSDGVRARNKAFLLPAYDEYIISYRDRSAVVDKAVHASVISSNGLFRPVVLMDGKATGIWKRRPVKNGFRIEMEFLDPGTKTGKAAFERAAESYDRFLDAKKNGKQ